MSPPVRLAFYRGSGLTGWAIRTATWSAYDHCAMLLDSGTVLDAEPGVGVSEHDPTRTPDAVFDLAVPAAAQHAAVKWTRTQIGCGYDWAAVFGVELHADWLTRGSWFCSDAICAAFNQAAAPLLRTDHVNRITPGLLLMSPMLVPVP